jgi:microcystin degradation protein MlrC
MLPSFRMSTLTAGPMTEVEALARDLTTGPVLDVTPFAGFPYADSAATGSSVMAFADRDPDAAARAAEAVADAMLARERQFAVSLPAPAAAFAAAAASPPGTIAILESADNIYSGGIGDTPGLLRALLAFDPVEPAVFAFLHDPALVERARHAGLGARLEARLGGRITPGYGPPVPATARVLLLTDGVFVNRGPMFAGLRVELGPTAVLETGTIRIIVTSRRQPVNDPAYFTLHGIDLAATRWLCAKGKTHIRAGLSPFCRTFIEVDTPGPAAIDLTRLPYRHADRTAIQLGG